MTNTFSAADAQLAKPPIFRTRVDLLAWVQKQPAAQLRTVMRAIFTYDTNAKWSDVWYHIEDWANLNGLTREQVQPVYNKTALEVAEFKQRKRETRENQKQTQERRRAVLRDRLLAEGYCKSRSHAYLLARSPHTTDKMLAQIMAEELGGIWPNYYRRPQKTGPRTKTVRRLMQLRPDNATFADFLEDSNLPDNLVIAAEVMARRDEHHFGAVYADDAEFLAIADLRGIETDQARLLWSHYEEWAVEIVAGYARQLVKIARRSITDKFDFG